MELQAYSRSVLSLALISFAVALSGCGGSSSSNPPPQPLQEALVVGGASGPIYQELQTAYQITSGNGTESAADYQILIYDGTAVTPKQIEQFATTNNFLSAGKILIVLDPTQADRQVIETLVGATALDDSPALALFNAYSNDGSLQTVNMVEFPVALGEDTIQTVPPGPSQSGSTPSIGAADEATLRQQTEQWRALYESKYWLAQTTVHALSGISSEQFAAAAADTGTTASPSALASGSNPDLASFLSPAQDVTPASNGSQFLSVQPFFHYLPRTLDIQSIYYQPRFQTVYPKAITPGNLESRGLCSFLPVQASFQMTPAQTTANNVNVETATYRMLEQYNSAYVHEIIARQFITSNPTVASSSTPPIGTETIAFCKGIAAVQPYCDPNPDLLCQNFSETHPLSSLRGFNGEVISTLSWDPSSAAMLKLDGLLPLTANNVTNLTTSSAYSRTVSWSIQGGLDFNGGTISGKNVGLNLGGSAGESHTWTWGTAQSMNLPDWQLTSNGLPPLPNSTYDFFAFNGPNSLANLKLYQTATGQTVPSFSGLTDLQQNSLVERNESDWSTKGKGTTLPASTATLTVAPVFNYGEVYNLYTLGQCNTYPFCAGRAVGMNPYGALHTFTLTPVQIALDFSRPLLQPPLPALWTISASLTPIQNPQGFYPVQGTVTLNAVSPTNTTIGLGAEVYPFGSTQPADTVIKSLPLSVTIPAGSLTANFTALAQNIGFPYNVRWWALQGSGRQTAYAMTVPAR